LGVACSKEDGKYCILLKRDEFGKTRFQMKIQPPQARNQFIHDPILKRTSCVPEEGLLFF